MRKLWLICALILFVLVACQSIDETEDPTSDQILDESLEETEKDAPKDEETSENDVNNEPLYTEVHYDTLIPVTTYVFSDDDEMLLVSLLTREEVLDRETALMMSLIESDQTTNRAFSQLEGIEIAGTEATLEFSGPQPFVSLASTEHMIVDDMFRQLGALYNITAFNFIVDGESGVDYGQVGFIETLPVAPLAISGMVEVIDEVLLEGLNAPVFRPMRDIVPLQLETFRATVEKTISFKGPQGYRNVFEGITVTNITEQGSTVDVVVSGELTEEKPFIHALAIMAAPFDFTTVNVIDEAAMTKTIIKLY